MALSWVGMVGVNSLLVVLFCTANAQGQELTEPYKKWLDCDVDWIFAEEAVGPSFLLKRSFHGTPVAGTRIMLNKDGKVAATATTNQKGVARFVSIPPGKYDLRSPDGLLFPSGRLVIEVKTQTCFLPAVVSLLGGSVAPDVIHEAVLSYAVLADLGDDSDSIRREDHWTARCRCSF